jgi:hypothetical protein
MCSAKVLVLNTLADCTVESTWLSLPLALLGVGTGLGMGLGMGLGTGLGMGLWLCLVVQRNGAAAATQHTTSSY